MPKKRKPYEKALADLARQVTAEGQTKPTKAATPMSRPPVDFSAVPEIDLSEEWMRQASPKPQVAAPTPSQRLKAPINPKNPPRAPMPPITADTVDMIPQSALPPQAPAGGAPPKPPKFVPKFTQKDYKAMTPEVRMRNLMEEGFRELAEGPSVKPVKKIPKKVQQSALKSMLKRLGLGAAVGGPMGAILSAASEAAAAEPVGIGQGMAGGVPGAEYVTGGPALVPAAQLSAMPAPDAMFGPPQVSIPPRVVGQSMPIPGFDVQPGQGYKPPYPPEHRMGGQLSVDDKRNIGAYAVPRY